MHVSTYVPFVLFGRLVGGAVAVEIQHVHHASVEGEKRIACGHEQAKQHRTTAKAGTYSGRSRIGLKKEGRKEGRKKRDDAAKHTHRRHKTTKRTTMTNIIAQ